MILLFLAALLAHSLANAAPTCPDCNVVLISLDTVAASHLGAYGSKRGASPRIDSLARSAWLYRNAFATAPWTMPSHLAMLTGFYPWHLGATTGLEPVHRDVPYLPQLLKDHGYKTAALTSGYFINRSYGYERGFDLFRESADTKDSEFLSKGASEWINGHKSEKFFLFLHSYAAHDPFRPSASSLARINPSYHGAVTSMSSPQIAKMAKGEEATTPRDFERMRDLYDAGVLDVDTMVGNVLDALEANGLTGRTLVVVTADHGEEFGEHGKWGLHGYTVYDELIRVPLIVKAPRLIPRVLASPVSGADIVPTVLSMLDIVPPRQLDGRVLPERDTSVTKARVVQSQTQFTFDFLMTVMEEVGNTMPAPQPRCEDRPLYVSMGTERALMAWPWKLIVKMDHSFELYDLGRDPLEKRNLYSARRATANRLMEQLLREP